MVYHSLEFPTFPNRPLFFSNFVSTIDGKVQVTTDPYAYWPIGSKTDYATLVGLRTYADALIHGKNTATWHKTFDSLAKEDFLSQRKSLGKGDLWYVVVSGSPDDSLLEFLQNPPQGVKALLATTQKAQVSQKLQKSVQIVRVGDNHVDIRRFSRVLFEKGIRLGLIEGGPHLMGSFAKEQLLDEIFLTISPKLFGNKKNTLTMVEGFLFPASRVPRYKLLSVKQVEDEIYVRYGMAEYIEV